MRSIEDEIANSMLTMQEVIANSKKEIKSLKSRKVFTSETSKWHNGEMIRRWEGINEDALEYLGTLIKRRERISNCREAL